MHHRTPRGRTAVLLATTLAVTALIAGLLHVAPLLHAATVQNTVWTLHIDTPENDDSDGTVEVFVEWEYQEGAAGTGKKHHETTKSTVTVKKGATLDEKIDAIVAKINEEAEKVTDDNGDDHPVYVAAKGLNNTIQIAPNTAGGTPFGNAKVKSVKVKDKKTKESDPVDPPLASMANGALAVLTLEGDIAGVDDGGDPSYLEMNSSFTGLLDLQLDGTMSFLDALDQVRQALVDGGATSYLDAAGPQLFVVLGEGDNVGLGSNDSNLQTSVHTLVP